MGRSSAWILVSVPAPPSSSAHLVVEALRRAGARAVEPEGERVVALLPAPADPERAVREVERAVRSVTAIDRADLHWRPLTDEEWTARWWPRREPVRVTDRIVVLPGDPLEEAPLSDRDVVIRLDPAAAFGTADHPTTRACLRALEALVEPGHRVLDVGAGTGVLAIAAALLGASRVRALESDPVACPAARANVRLNGVGDRVAVRERQVAAGRRLGRWDVVAANLQAGILLPLLPTLRRSTRRDGWLVLAGPLRGEREQVLREADRAGLEVVDERVDDGWWSGTLRHRCMSTPSTRS